MSDLNLASPKILKLIYDVFHLNALPYIPHFRALFQLLYGADTKNNIRFKFGTPKTIEINV